MFSNNKMINSEEKPRKVETVSTLYELLDLQNTGEFENDGTIKLKRPENITNDLKEIRFRGFASDVRADIQNIQKPELKCEITARVLQFPTDENDFVDSPLPDDVKNARLTLATRDITQSQTFAKDNEQLLSIAKYTVPLSDSIDKSIELAYDLANEEMTNRLGIIDDNPETPDYTPKTNKTLVDASSYNYGDIPIKPVIKYNQPVDFVNDGPNDFYISLNPWSTKSYKPEAEKPEAKNRDYKLRHTYAIHVNKSKQQPEPKNCYHLTVVMFKASDDVNNPELIKEETTQPINCAAFEFNPITNCGCMLTVSGGFMTIYSLKIFFDESPDFTIANTETYKIIWQFNVKDSINIRDADAISGDAPYYNRLSIKTTTSRIGSYQICCFIDRCFILAQFYNYSGEQLTSDIQTNLYTFRYDEPVGFRSASKFISSLMNILTYSPDSASNNALIPVEQYIDDSDNDYLTIMYMELFDTPSQFDFVNHTLMINRYVTTSNPAAFQTDNNSFKKQRWVRKSCAFGRASATITNIGFTYAYNQSISISESEVNNYKLDTNGKHGNAFSALNTAHSKKQMQAFDIIPVDTWEGLDPNNLHPVNARFVKYTATVNNTLNQPNVYVSGEQRFNFSNFLDFIYELLNNNELPPYTTNITRNYKLMLNKSPISQFNADYFKTYGVMNQPPVNVNTNKPGFGFDDVMLTFLSDNNETMIFLNDSLNTINIEANGYVSMCSLLYERGADGSEKLGPNVCDSTAYKFNVIKHRKPWFATPSEQPGNRLTHPPKYINSMFKVHKVQEVKNGVNIYRLHSVDLPVAIVTDAGDSTGEIKRQSLIIFGLRIDTEPHYFNIDSQNISFPNFIQDLPNYDKQKLTGGCSLSVINAPIDDMLRIYNEKVFNNLRFYLLIETTDTALRFKCDNYQSPNQLVFHLNESAMIDFKNMQTPPAMPYITCKIVDSTGEILTPDLAKALYSNISVSLDWAYFA